MLKADKERIDELLSNVAEGREGAEKIFTSKRDKMGEQGFLETVRRIALYTTDALWMEHLEQMDYLRSSVNLRAYGQREPIVEYKKEGLKMFKEMEEAFKEEVFSLISSINAESGITVQTEPNAPVENFVPSHVESNTNPAETLGKEPGRNDPCPCGAINPATGEVYKYKKCGLINAPQHRKALIN